MTQTHDEILEILKKAYQIEVDGYTFYSMTADRASKPAVQELFDKLARDEVQHKAYLQSVIGSYQEKGLAAFNIKHRDPDLRAFTASIFTEEFKTQAEGADFELGALSIGMTLETNAIKYFTGAAESTAEKEVREFYEFLADWERQHLDALQGLYNGVRQDFWSDSGFSPF
ncbi:MAG: ferritin family protein [Acidobacteria bacterium]|jgi:rubrerythrin|nr:ferritin family protein [Acidobacteriota bacterium]